MTATTQATVRAAVAARITLLGSPWWEAPVPPDLHSWSQVPDAVPSTRAHGSFSVRLPSSAAAPGERHKTGTGYRVTHRLTVRFLARVTPKDAIASYDAALALETALIASLDSGWSGDLTMYYQGTERTTAQTGEWIQIECLFALTHLVALS